MMVNTWLTDADYLSDIIVGEPIVPDCLNQSLGGINDASGGGGEFAEALNGRVYLLEGRLSSIQKNVKSLLLSSEKLGETSARIGFVDQRP
jgi:hypothetical protein